MFEKGNRPNLIRRLRLAHGKMTQQLPADRTGVTRLTRMALESAFRIVRVFQSTVDLVFC